MTHTTKHEVTKASLIEWLKKFPDETAITFGQLSLEKVEDHGDQADFVLWPLMTFDTEQNKWTAEPNEPPIPPDQRIDRPHRKPRPK